MPWVASAVEMRSNPRTLAWRQDRRGGTMGVVEAGGVMGLVVSVTPPLNNRLLIGVAVAALFQSKT